MSLFLLSLLGSLVSQYWGSSQFISLTFPDASLEMILASAKLEVDRMRPYRKHNSTGDRRIRVSDAACFYYPPRASLNKGMKLTKPIKVGASQLIPRAGRT